MKKTYYFLLSLMILSNCYPEDFIESEDESDVVVYATMEEGDEPDESKLSELSLKTDKLKLYLGGRLKDDCFVYNRVYTLRSDFNDQHDFVRHKLYLDFLIDQGDPKQEPSSQAFIRLCNYIFWQNESAYLPMVVDEIRNNDPDNTLIAKNVPVRSLMPLIFVAQAWFKLNFHTFCKAFYNHPTFLKLGFFPYIVGRGVTMGFHDDLAVDYLGWAGDGGFTRYPVMPPGVLFRTAIKNNLSWDLYFNVWRETNGSISDTLKPTRAERLFGPRPERGKGKDRISFSTRLDYINNDTPFGNILAQPYCVYVSAPEQGIEFDADASSKLWTLGTMVDWHYNNWSVNVEVAGQFGRQRVHAIDRNVIQFQKSDDSGNVQSILSHIVQQNATSNLSIPARRTQNTPPPPINNNFFDPQNRSTFLVDTSLNRDLAQQGEKILYSPEKAAQFPAPIDDAFNSNFFGNNRFRNPYTLWYNGFMALADISYDFDDLPLRIAGAAGCISGDSYPYNNETSRTFNGFIPLRSRYRGLGVQNILIFDRLVIPRPLNISYKTLYAFNNVKDLNNLEFIGLGLTWFPFKERNKGAITADVMLLWEYAELNKWDINGKHPDPAIEKQLVIARNTLFINANTFGNPTKFSGWESNEKASRMLGTEIDIKAVYHLLDHCDFNVKFAFFFPGDLYRDLAGQPNIITQRIDELGFQRVEGLGHSAALAFVCGLDYRF